jgi:hypothetical protein
MTENECRFLDVEMTMLRRDLVLALLASAGGAPYTSVQIQKATFLVTKQLPSLVDGPCFEFLPNRYGPYDPRVYDEANALAAADEVTIRAALQKWSDWKWYSVTPAGTSRAERLLASLPSDVRSYLEEVTTWVRSQYLTGLLKSIYKAYPDSKMIENIQEQYEYYDEAKAHSFEKLDKAPAIDPPKPPTV